MDRSAPEARPDLTYRTLDPMPWGDLVGPIAAAEDAVARLDERLAGSPIRDGFIARAHFAEACASLWLDGELVHVEDLILHDAAMDVRTPTAELVQAHAVLRARRRVAGAAPGWALSPAGLDALRGRAAAASPEPPTNRVAIDEDWFDDLKGGDDAWTQSLAAIDAALSRSSRVLAGQQVDPRPRAERPSLVYDLDWDEDDRIAEWRRVVDVSSQAPATLAAAIALDAWNQIEPLQTQVWLGRLMSAELMRQRGKSRAHLTCFNIGLKATPQNRRWKRDPLTRLIVMLEAVAAAALAGLKEHDRLVMAKMRLDRRTGDRRSSSRLPQLVDLAIASPLVSAGLIAARLKVTPRAAMSLAAELGLREATGRTRYRAWTVD